MSELQQRLLTEADTGVPDHIFTPGFNGDIQTKHGNQLHCIAAESYVLIKDPKPIQGATQYTNFEVQAMVTTNTLAGYDASLLPVIKFFMLTWHNTARPPLHPDLRARALAGRIIQYFDSTADKPIKTFHADWFADKEARTEYDRYHDALGKSYDEATRKERHAAVESTFAHTIAMDEGFTDLREVEKRGEGPDTYISAYFVRP